MPHVTTYNTRKYNRELSIDTGCVVKPISKETVLMSDTLIVFEEFLNKMLVFFVIVICTSVVVFGISKNNLENLIDFFTP